MPDRSMLLPACMLLGILSSTAARAGPAFVGCGADGQVGPYPPPTALDLKFKPPASLPPGFVLYAARDMIAVAPAGWACTERYGSNGSFLWLAPTATWSGLSARQHAMQGPGMEVSLSLGDTSGRFEVARIVARMFPQRRDYVQHVVAGQNFLPPGGFPAEPYPADIIRRVQAQSLFFTTPAGDQGLGTQSWLAADADPIEGFVHLTADNDLLMIQMRLPSPQAAQASAAIEVMRRIDRRFGD